MNLPTASLVILFGLTVSMMCDMHVPALTFEQRWEPVQPLLQKQDREQRPLTFEERWEPVKQLPQMLLQEQPKLEPRVIPVRTITIRKEDVVPAVQAEPVEQVAAEVPLPAPRPKGRASIIRVKQASLDICQRHGMHKVNYGKRWRCRK